MRQTKDILNLVRSQNGLIVEVLPVFALCERFPAWELQWRNRFRKP